MRLSSCPIPKAASPASFQAKREETQALLLSEHGPQTSRLELQRPISFRQPHTPKKALPVPALPQTTNPSRFVTYRPLGRVRSIRQLCQSIPAVKPRCADNRARRRLCLTDQASRPPSRDSCIPPSPLPKEITRKRPLSSKGIAASTFPSDGALV